MSKEPLLTRKALREHVVPKKPFLERYNRFLTIWMIAMIVLLIVAIGVQIFL